MTLQLDAPAGPAYRHRSGELRQFGSNVSRSIVVGRVLPWNEARTADVNAVVALHNWGMAGTWKIAVAGPFATRDAAELDDLVFDFHLAGMLQ